MDRRIDSGWVIGWLAAVAIAVHVTPAAAQDTECFPPCRSGFMCHEGACISACNPPCPEGQACQGGECVVSAAPAPTAPPQPAAPVQQAPAEPQQLATSVAAPADPAASGGWVTVPSGGGGGAPQPAGDDRRDELRQIRKQLHFAAYLSPGFVYTGAPQGDDIRFVSGDLELGETFGGGSYSNGHFALAIGLGLGVRGNFAYLVGFQARAYFDLFPSLPGYVLIEDDLDASCAGDARDCEATGIGFRFGADVSFRIGPFAQAFPMYIGIGGFAGGRQLSASSELADYNRFVPEVGTLAELGFIFGGNENMDLGARFEFGPKLGDEEAFFVGVYLSFGLALASTGP